MIRFALPAATAAVFVVASLSLQWWEGYVELLVRAGVAEKDASDSSRCDQAFTTAIGICIIFLLAL
jgi:hypothetical protein